MHNKAEFNKIFLEVDDNENWMAVKIIMVSKKFSFTYGLLTCDGSHFVIRGTFQSESMTLGKGLALM